MHKTTYCPQENNLTENGIVIFSDKEINSMPKQIKKLLIIEKKRCHIRQHSNKKGYEIRLRRDGYDISASGITIELAKENFIKKLKTAKPIDNEFDTPNTFNSFALFFFENFRKERVAVQTYKADMNRYNNYLLPTFKEKELSKITTLEEFLIRDNSLSDIIDTVAAEILERSCELKVEQIITLSEDSTVLDLALEYYEEDFNKNPDVTLDYFIRTNNLSDDDFFLLKRGTDVKIYV